jgi:putative RNA 2'-phosphotransferase
MKTNLVTISKFLSIVLRHAPETIHLEMDKNGWVNIQHLIDNAYTYNKPCVQRKHTNH